MNYEINVSLDGVHFFATHERSLKTRKQADLLFELFKLKFTKSKGYSLSLSEKSSTSKKLRVINAPKREG